MVRLVQNKGIIIILIFSYLEIVDSIEIVLEESTTSEDEEEPKREEAMRSLLGLAFVVESDQEIFERMSGHGGAEDPLFDGYGLFYLIMILTFDKA